jgi:hypothetical protein
VSAPVREPSGIAQGVYPPAGDRPPVELAMGVLDVTTLPGPALLAMGIARDRPDGLLREGWRWLAFRSLAHRLAPKRLDEPERWVSIETVSLRLAGPWFRLPRRETTRGEDRRGRRRVVLLWTRDRVTLVKATRSKRTGVRPEKTGTWGSEAWCWVSGLPGSLPRAVDVTVAKQIIRRDTP